MIAVIVGIGLPVRVVPDLLVAEQLEAAVPPHELAERFHDRSEAFEKGFGSSGHGDEHDAVDALHPGLGQGIVGAVEARHELALVRSEEHTSELQSLMRNSYAGF